ncbi:MAG: GlpM family protein [Pseudomonadota bacterium]|nr:GlpM family protein [Pseudomonadota bacterium]
MLSLALKCVLGALAVLMIALLAKTRSFYIAGLVPLFPTFAIIAHYIVGSERLASDLRSTAIFGLWSLLPYAAYLFSIVLLSERFTLVVTLTVGALAWAVAAGLLLTVWTRVYPAV